VSKIRQDAWSEEDDLLLAETVLRHVREGSTQLHAFEEVGDKLERTSAAVGFRWNAIVRKKYEQALKIAKKQRKERHRALAKSQQQQATKPIVNPSPAKPAATPQIHDDETYHPEEFFKTPYTYDRTEKPVNRTFEQPAAQPAANPITSSAPSVYQQPQASKQEELTIDEVIDFLSGLKRNGMSNGKLVQENMELRLQMNELLQQNKVITEQLTGLQNDYQTIQEDYQALIQIMDRARKMVLFQDEATNGNANQSFRMDKNGNLEKMAK
jgi:prespore-specific regulator